MTTSNLDSFVTHAKALPAAVAISSDIEDRDSIFIGSLYRISSLAEAERALAHHKHVLHASKPASHEIAAWRFMTLRPGRNGLGGPSDFEVKSASDDDGEEHGGRTILRTMEKQGVIDALVIVSRWFGGILLGPVRFTHIETCTHEVCQTFKATEDVEAIIEELKKLDDKLSVLRSKLAAISPADPSTDSVSSPVPVKNKLPDYNALLLTPVPDLAKAKRLVNARQSAIRSVNAIIAKVQTENK